MQRGFPSDPVKAWKDLQKKAPEEDLDDDASSVASSTSSSGGPDFGYLLSMSLLSLSREKKEELLKERDNKVSSLHDQVQITSRIALRQMNPWIEGLGHNSYELLMNITWWLTLECFVFFL